MQFRRRIARWILRMGERVRTSRRLRWALTNLGVAGPARAAYGRWMDALVGDDVEVHVNGTTATLPGLSPAHLTNELPVLRDFVAEVDSRNADVWDVGAAIGLFGIPAAKVTDGIVVAFEPFPQQLDRLRTNVSENGADRSLEVFDVALAAERGQRAFDTETAELSTDGTGRRVEVWPGDEFAAEREVPTPDVLKIDVEGAEVAVLEGLSETLRSGDCDVVYVEVHPERVGQFGASEDDVDALLGSYGYDHGVLQTSRDGRYTVKAVADDS